MQKIKEKLHIGREKHGRTDVNDTYGTTGGDTYGTTGTTGLAGTTAADTYGTTGGGLAGTGTDTYGTTGGTYGATGTDTYGTTGTDTYGTSGERVERPVAVGTAEVPVVVTEEERLRTGGHHHGEHHRHHGVEEVCGTKTFTEVEDRPIVIERVERVLEHQPVEKEYVVETKFVGERSIPSATGATVIDSTERIVERAEPGPKCPIGTGQMMDEAVGRQI